MGAESERSNNLEVANEVLNKLVFILRGEKRIFTAVSKVDHRNCTDEVSVVY